MENISSICASQFNYIYFEIVTLILHWLFQSFVHTNICEWIYTELQIIRNIKFEKFLSLSLFPSIYLSISILSFEYRLDVTKCKIQTKTHTNIQYQYQRTHTHISTMSSVKALASLQLISVLCWNGSFMHNCNMHNNDIANQKSTNICMHTSEHTSIHACAQNMETHL